ncbi:MAG TPA: LuxR C-terminal-related transcriptional regulator [Sporichthyaceae bacterium]|nr:LuxR C-terminal-related transcriptional regulator [Sporichthyaceae bacterium]
MSTSREGSGSGLGSPGAPGDGRAAAARATVVGTGGVLSATDHVRLGGRCFADDDFEGARGHWEVAFRELRSGGDLRYAVRVAGDLAGLHVAAWGSRAVARGWIDRGLRLLGQVGHCVEEGYLALGILGCDWPDVEALEAAAELALSLAVEFADPVLEVRALAESGFALVIKGHLARGFARLDEAMAAVTSGEIDDLAAIGKCFCAMFSACDRSGDLHRAQEWTSEWSRFIERREWRPRIMQTHCRAVYGSVLSTLGRWSEAEQALLDALSPDASRAMNHRVETSARLAELRLRQGRVAEAEELLGPFEDCVDCCAPLARLHLVQGRVELAAAVIERGLGELVGDRVRSAPLLALSVDVDLARDDLDAAVDTVAQLNAMAREAEWPLLNAEAALAAAKVATRKGETGSALELLGQMQEATSNGDRPLLAGQMHLARARAWSQAAEITRAVSEGRAALAVFERLGAVRDADEAAAVLRSLGDRRRLRRPDAATSMLSGREREVLELLGQGLTNSEIGARLYISAKTAEHHVSAVLAKLGVRSRAEAAAMAARLTPRS